MNASNDSTDRTGQSLGDLTAERGDPVQSGQGIQETNLDEATGSQADIDEEEDDRTRTGVASTPEAADQIADVAKKST
jgi:hypothetical protein